MKTIQTLTIVTAMMISSVSLASTKCDHRLSAGGGLFQNTNPPAVTKVAAKAVAATTSTVGVR